MSDPGPVLDTVALRTMAFAHATGLDVLLAALAVPHARVPAEVYNRDEATLPLDSADHDLSGLARGLRFAQRQTASRPLAEARRYQTWLDHARQIAAHLDRGTLVVDPLVVDELPERERLRQEYGIGRGEAAGIILAMREGAVVVFVSSDARACRVAADVGVVSLTLIDVLRSWIDRLHPAPAQFETLVAGLSDARFALSATDALDLRGRLPR